MRNFPYNKLVSQQLQSSNKKNRHNVCLYKNKLNQQCDTTAEGKKLRLAKQ